MKIKKVSLPKLIGKGYKDYWDFTGRYRVCKGSRASKKSKTTALNFIYRLMKYPKANLLVVRKVFRTLKDSAYTDLRWAIRQLQVDDYWDYKESPLELVYKPTGQKVLFRGLDEPMKLTSITVDVGSLCWCWIEESYEITKESDFNMLDESIRGQVNGNLFKQITLTLNPWNEGHWIKKRFFDAKPCDDILAKTTNYLCNEFLDESDLRLFERMKAENPRRYRVAGLGEWGISEGLIYENWEEKEFDVQEILNNIPDIESSFGLDFGYTNDPTALFCGLISLSRKEIYVFDELYKKALTNRMIADEIISMGKAKEKIVADSAEPKSIDELYDYGLYRVIPARKGKDSINNGIQFIQGFKITVHPRCVNFLTEISNYTWTKDKFDRPINKPIDDFNHLMDAMRYALEGFSEGDTFSFD
ncbi:PBSX family phage terminase large subunit [Fusobacterium sp. SYSU M8A802]